MPRSRLVERLWNFGFHRPSPDRGVLDLNGGLRCGYGLEFFYSQTSDGRQGLKVWMLDDGSRSYLLWPCITPYQLRDVAVSHAYLLNKPVIHRASVLALCLIAVIGESRLGDAAILREEHSPQGGPASECASSGN